MNKKRFVLLDRDGTIVIEKNYLSNPEEVELIPGAAEALKRLRQMGLGLVIITNQSGIGRGYFDLVTLEKIHKKVTDLLAEKGVFLDDIYFCPHTPEDNCLCRKPKVEMVELAMKKHHFDPKLCFVVGDNRADIELGKNIGATTILVKTGYGNKLANNISVKPDYVINDLWKAPNIIHSIITNE